MSLSLLLALPARLHADDIRARAAEGNELYAAGEYEKALDAYQAAGDELPDDVRAEVLFNRAAAQFKLGKLDEARELWVRVASTRDSRFEALSRFNIGNCHYAKALAALETADPNAATTATQALDDAAAQYRDALRLDQQLASARANLELTAKLKEEIKKNSTTQPQSQPTSGQQQQDPNDPNQPETQPSSQPGQGSGQQDPSAQQDPNSRQDPNQQDPNQQEQQDPNQQDPNSQREPNAQEQDPNQQQGGSEGEQQPETQPSPLPDPNAQDPNQPAPDPNQMIKLSPEEARRLLQMVRDAEKARREELRRRQAARYRPVEKDW